jgi:crotonobetainyl-CoA:carnitine CoA-transferase CaiB-like acyl-CoA transferase
MHVPAQRESPTSTGNGPLRGYLVLDFGQAAVGPVAAEYLGMLGATVIKVESPRGDLVRNISPLMKGTSTTFLGNNLTKFDIVLDLKAPADKQRAKDLIRVADVLIENFRSNEIMVRLGLGYEVLREINPDLVYVSSSAYGNGGPLENMRSNEWITEALSGFTSVTGSAGGPGEFSRATANLDWNGAMLNTVALLAALVRRARVKHGGYFVTSQLGSSVYGGITRFADVLAGRTPLGPLGAASADIVPDDAFRAVDGYIIVSALTERCWQRLCEGLEQPELCKNSRFATNAVRVDNRTELTQLLAEIFAQETTATWCERLTAADVPCAPAPKPMRLLDALNSHPQIRECQLVARIPSAYGLLASHAPHWSFERTPASIASGSPLLGEHTELVLANMTDKQGLIAALEADRHKSSVPAMEPA